MKASAIPAFHVPGVCTHLASHQGPTQEKPLYLRLLVMCEDLASRWPRQWGLSFLPLEARSPRIQTERQHSSCSLSTSTPSYSSHGRTNPASLSSNRSQVCYAYGCHKAATVSHKNCQNASQGEKRRTSRSWEVEESHDLQRAEKSSFPVSQGSKNRDKQWELTTRDLPPWL